MCYDWLSHCLCETMPLTGPFSTLRMIDLYEWICSSGGMILPGESRRTRMNTSPNVTLCKTDPSELTWKRIRSRWWEAGDKPPELCHVAVCYVIFRVIRRKTRFKGINYLPIAVTRINVKHDIPTYAVHILLPTQIHVSDVPPPGNSRALALVAPQFMSHKVISNIQRL